MSTIDTTERLTPEDVARAAASAAEIHGHHAQRSAGDAGLVHLLAEDLLQVTAEAAALRAERAALRAECASLHAERDARSAERDALRRRLDRQLEAERATRACLEYELSVLRKQAIEARTAATQLQTAVDVLQGVLRGPAGQGAAGPGRVP